MTMQHIASQTCLRQHLNYAAVVNDISNYNYTQHFDDSDGDVNDDIY